MSVQSFTPANDALYSVLSNDPELAPLVLQYVDEMPRRVEQFDRYFESHNWDGLRQLAHQMKGAAGSYGFSRITEAAARLEKLSCGSQSAQEIGAALDELKRLCSLIRAGRPPLASEPGIC